MRTWQFFLLFLITIGLNSCELLNEYGNSGNIEVLEVRTSNSNSGNFAKIFLSVQNNGPGVAYSVNFSVKLKRGNQVIENESGYFGNLSENEMMEEECWFTKINRHTEYDRAEFFISWYDYNDNSYSTSYTFYP